MWQTVEILIRDFPTKQLNCFLEKELQINSKLIKSSHFYDEGKEENTTYERIKNIEEYYQSPATGHIIVQGLSFGDFLEDVMIIISADSFRGDILLNFPKKNFECEKKTIEIKVNKIINFCKYLLKKFEISEICIGYESAYDEDMLMFVIKDAEIITINKNFCKLLQEKIF